MKRSFWIAMFFIGLLPANSSGQWVQCLPMNSPVINLTTTGTTLIAGTSGRDTAGWTYSDSGYQIHLATTLHLTTDNGTSWTSATGIPLGGSVNGSAVQNSTIFMAIADAEGKFYDINGRTTIYAASPATNYHMWDPVLAFTPNFYYHCWSMATTNENLYIGGVIDGVSAFYRSVNGGGSWIAGAGIDNVSALLALSDTNIFAGTFGSGVRHSTDKGAHWTPANSGLPQLVFSQPILCLASSGAYLFAGTPLGVFRSSDKGNSWTRTINSLIDTNVTSLVVSGSTIFAGTSTQVVDSVYYLPGYGWFAGLFGGGVFRSTDYGTTWNAVNTGFPASPTSVGSFCDLDVQALAVSGGYLFAGSHAGGVWRRPLSDMTTYVDHVVPELPLQCRLEQNYPNPFNPTTTVRFTIGGVVAPSGIYHERRRGGEGPAAAHVRLIVYDMLGREVANLVDEKKSTGDYAVTFDSKGLASGVYIYRLAAGPFVQSRKMILLR